MKNNRKEITILSLVIVFVLTILLSSSYAWFTVTAESNNTTTIKVGDLNLAFTDNNQDVELLNKTPISIDDAFEEDGYTFTLTNTGSIKSKYTVVLEDKELNDGESRLDNKYVRYILKSGGSTKIGFISDLTEGKLVEGILVKNGEVTYNLKLFLDEDVFDKDAAGKILKKEIKISAEQDNSDVSANQILTPMTITTISGNSKSNSLDIVKIGDEEFYNIGNGEGKEAGKVKLFARESLSSDNKQMENYDNHVRAIFSKTMYWRGQVGDGLKYPGNFEQGPKPYVYDENSIIYPYIESYIGKLSEVGVTNISGRLLSYEEAKETPTDVLKSTDSYHLGSLVEMDTLYSYHNSIGYSWDYKTLNVTIRPVILIPSYYLN